MDPIGMLSSIDLGGDIKGWVLRVDEEKMKY
jgi:hypothetical protein